MKKILTQLALIVFLSGTALSSLTKVEKMTQEEINELRFAEKAVVSAEENVKKVKEKIAKTHGMIPEAWMEWRTTVEFDGPFILLRWRGFMPQNSEE